LSALSRRRQATLRPAEGYRALFAQAPPALLSLHDHATGPRHVQRLARVELVKLW